MRLTKGQFAVVDSDMFDELNAYRWKFSTNGYAVRNEWIEGAGGKYRVISMHRVIMRVDDADHEVDHRDRNRLNNFRDNLRITSCFGNNQNASKRKDNTSGVKGVSFSNQRGKWQAYINANKKTYNLGFFDQKEDAISARLAKAKELHGEFHCEG